MGFCPGEDQLAELLGQKVSAFGERCPSARLAAGLLIAAHIESPDLVGCRWNGGNRVERDGGLDLPAVAQAFGRHFPGGVELPLRLAVHYPRVIDGAESIHREMPAGLRLRLNEYFDRIVLEDRQIATLLPGLIFGLKALHAGFPASDAQIEKRVVAGEFDLGLLAREFFSPNRQESIQGWAVLPAGIA